MSSKLPACRVSHSVTLWHKWKNIAVGKTQNTWILSINDNNKSTRSIRRLVCHPHQREPLANGLHCSWMLPVKILDIKHFPRLSLETQQKYRVWQYKNILILRKYLRKNNGRRLKFLYINTKSEITTAEQLAKTFPNFGKNGSCLKLRQCLKSTYKDSVSRLPK